MINKDRQDKVAAAIEAAIRPNAEPYTAQELHQIAQEKLNQAYKWLQSEPRNVEAAGEIVDCFARMLRSGRPDHATSVAAALFVSAHPTEFCRTILNFSIPTGRKPNTARVTHAIDTYLFQLSISPTEPAVAQRAAYDAYFLGVPKHRTYAGDLLESTDEINAPAHANKAEQTMATVILPMLRKANVLALKAPGRPRGAKS